MEAHELFKLPVNGEKKVSRIYKGYAYKIDRRTANQIYLACLKKSDKLLRCKGRCTLIDGKVNETGIHNHPPDYLLEEKQKFNNALRIAAKQKLGTFKECYQRYSKEYPEAAAKLNYGALANNFKKWMGGTDSTNSADKSHILEDKSSSEDNIRNLEDYMLELNKNQDWFIYNVTISRQKCVYQITTNLIRNDKYKHLLIYDSELMEKICDARKIIVHKIVSVVPKKCASHVINILFEKYEKALAGFWFLMEEDEEICYHVLFKCIKMLFPNFNPKQAVVDYNTNIRNGLQTTFPNIEIIPCFLHQIQEIFENAMKTNAAVELNRIQNTEKDLMLRKFMALSFLPQAYILPSYSKLIIECKTKYGTYFNSFIDYYTSEWMESWKPETFSVYRLKYLSKNFLDLYGYRRNFRIGFELLPFHFLKKIRSILISVRTELDLLEHGEVLSYYLSPEDEEREMRLFRSWNRLDSDLITINECLVICSNLLNEDFMDSLPDLVTDNKKASCLDENNHTNNELTDTEDPEDTMETDMD